jgi:hypothetical protein
MGGVPHVPNGDFWLSTTVHISAPASVDLPVMHHFLGVLEGASDQFVDSTGVPVGPEVPPVPSYTPPAGWEWLWDFIAKLWNWLFVPDAAHLALLMPSGTLGSQLLENTSWGTGGSSWSISGHWMVGGVSTAVPIVSVDFGAMTSNPFVVAVKLIVQAGMCLGLIYMVIVLV